MLFDISKEYKFTSDNIFNAPLIHGQKVNLDTYYDAAWKGIGQNGNYAYSADGSYIYFTQFVALSGVSLKCMHVASRNVENLVSPCEIVDYGKMTLSKDGKYMTVEKRYKKLTGFFPTPTVRREIVVIDLATMKEKVVNY